MGCPLKGSVVLVLRKQWLSVAILLGLLSRSEARRHCDELKYSELEKDKYNDLPWGLSWLMYGVEGIAET